MILRVIKYGIKNTLRNKFLSFSSILVLGLLMFFINILLVLHNISFKLIESINEKLTISLYLQETYNKNSVEVIGLINDIKKFSNTIHIDYKTKEQALEDVRVRDPELVNILERTNPLPETIILSNIDIDEFETVDNIIEKRLFILSLDQQESKDKFGYNSQYERIEKVTTVLKTLQMGLYIIIAIFVVSIAIIVYSIIGNFIYYYKDEIYITRLVGGNKLFVHGPFIFQGIIYNFFACILSTVMFLLLLKNIGFLFEQTFKLDFLVIGTLTFLLELFLFTLIGGISGYYSSKKYISSYK